MLIDRSPLCEKDTLLSIQNRIKSSINKTYYKNLFLNNIKQYICLYMAIIDAQKDLSSQNFIFN